MRSLDQLVDMMERHARTVLIGSATEQIVPFVHIQFKDRDDAIMPALFSDERQKSAFIDALRYALKAFRGSVVNYAMISEAWVAEQNHRPRDDDLPPSKRETRRESVIVSAGDHDGARMKVWEIIRDDKGRVTDLVEKAMKDKWFEGRMFNLLGDDDA
jgi:hypothetical protein